MLQINSFDDLSQFLYLLDYKVKFQICALILIYLIFQEDRQSSPYQHIIHICNIDLTKAMFFGKHGNVQSKQIQKVNIIQERDQETDTNQLQLIIRLKQLENHKKLRNQINYQKSQTNQQSSNNTATICEKPISNLQNYNDLSSENGQNSQRNQGDDVCPILDKNTPNVPQEIDGHLGGMMQHKGHHEKSFAVKQSDLKAQIPADCDELSHINFFSDLIPVLKNHYTPFAQDLNLSAGPHAPNEKPFPSSVDRPGQLGPHSSVQNIGSSQKLDEKIAGAEPSKVTYISDKECNMREAPCCSLQLDSQQNNDNQSNNNIQQDQYTKSINRNNAAPENQYKVITNSQDLNQDDFQHFHINNKKQANQEELNTDILEGNCPQSREPGEDKNQVGQELSQVNQPLPESFCLLPKIDIEMQHQEQNQKEDPIKSNEVSQLDPGAPAKLAEGPGIAAIGTDEVAPGPQINSQEHANVGPFASNQESDNTRNHSSTNEGRSSTSPGQGFMAPAKIAEKESKQVKFDLTQCQPMKNSQPIIVKMNGLAKSIGKDVENSKFFISQPSQTNHESMSSQEFVLVSYKAKWIDGGQTEISDQFLWPKEQRDIKQMKIFAIDFLSDTLGRKNIGNYNTQHVEGFANFIAYIINREIDLADLMNEHSPQAMVMDGVFGNSTQSYGEHLVTIVLNYKGFTDVIEWDICNPDNQPEDFAAQLVGDLQLEPAQEYLVAISYEIRKQIMIHVCQTVQRFSSIYESYIQHQVDEYEQMQMFNFGGNYDERERLNLSKIDPQILYASLIDGQAMTLDNPKVREKIQNNRLYDEMKSSENAQMIFSNGSFTGQMKAPFKDVHEELQRAKQIRCPNQQQAKSLQRQMNNQKADNQEKESELSELPDFLQMPKLQQYNKELSELDDTVLLAGIMLRHSDFWPQPIQQQKKQLFQVNQQENIIVAGEPKEPQQEPVNSEHEVNSEHSVQQNVSIELQYDYSNEEDPELHDDQLQPSSGAESCNDEFSLDQNIGDDGLHSLRSSNARAQDGAGSMSSASDHSMSRQHLSNTALIGDSQHHDFRKPAAPKPYLQRTAPKPEVDNSHLPIIPARERKDGTIVFTKNENYQGNGLNKREQKQRFKFQGSDFSHEASANEEDLEGSYKAQKLDSESDAEMVDGSENMDGAEGSEEIIISESERSEQAADISDAADELEDFTVTLQRFQDEDSGQELFKFPPQASDHTGKAPDRSDAPFLRPIDVANNGHTNGSHQYQKKSVPKSHARPTETRLRYGDGRAKILLNTGSRKERGFQIQKQGNRSPFDNQDDSNENGSEEPLGLGFNTSPVKNGLGFKDFSQDTFALEKEERPAEKEQMEEVAQYESNEAQGNEQSESREAVHPAEEEDFHEAEAAQPDEEMTSHQQPIQDQAESQEAANGIDNPSKGSKVASRGSRNHLLLNGVSTEQLNGKEEIVDDQSIENQSFLSKSSKNRGNSDLNSQKTLKSKISQQNE